MLCFALATIVDLLMPTAVADGICCCSVYYLLLLQLLVSSTPAAGTLVPAMFLPWLSSAATSFVLLFVLRQ